MSGELNTYPLFDTVTGDFIFRPSFPAPPYPIYVSLDQLRDYVGGFPNYTLVIPTNGQTLNVPSTDKYLMNPVDTIATLILRLPDAVDKRTIRIASRQRIAALIINSAVGATVDWSVNEFPQHGNVDFTYVASLNTWVRA